MIPLGIFSKKSSFSNLTQGLSVNATTQLVGSLTNLTAGIRRTNAPSYTGASIISSYDYGEDEDEYRYSNIGFQIVLPTPKSVSRINICAGYGSVSGTNGIGSEIPNVGSWSANGIPANYLSIIFTNSVGATIRTINNVTTNYLFSQIDFLVVNDVRGIDFLINTSYVNTTVAFAGVEAWGN